jgi:hypothetical protein
MDSHAQRLDITPAKVGRLAEVRHGIDDLVEWVAILRAVRLRQLADARSGRPSRGSRVPAQSVSAA